MPEQGLVVLLDAESEDLQRPIPTRGWLFGEPEGAASPCNFWIINPSPHCRLGIVLANHLPMHRLPGFGILVLSFLVGLVSSAPASALAKPQVGLVRSLRQLGYQPAIAARIAKTNPHLASQIVARKSKPKLLYRGMDIDSSQFSPTFISTDPFKKLCFSDNAKFAVGYAANYPAARLRHGGKEGVMIEAQVPSMLLSDPRAELVFHVDQNKVADISPFIRRVGVIDLKRVKFHPNGDLDEQGTLERLRWSRPR
jgi:hypothetical protein